MLGKFIQATVYRQESADKAASVGLTIVPLPSVTRAELLDVYAASVEGAAIPDHIGMAAHIRK